MESHKAYNYTMFKYFTRRFKSGEAEPPGDVKDIFATWSEGNPHLTPEQLQRFLAKYQGGDEAGCTLADAHRIMAQVHHQRHLITRHTRHSLNFDDFFFYLFSDSLNPAIKSQVHHDMTAPLAHYFIYTGHNSYLTGNQLSSDCSDAPIIKALQKGVRVIELDLWPNPTKDDVQVFHGRTLTAPVMLSKCLKSIKEYAFIASVYPVIITLEDHLTSDLQAKVAKMVIETFGEMLYYPDSDCLDNFPSPEALKRRVVLSTKPPKQYLENTKHRRTTSQKEREISEENMPGKLTSDASTDVDSDYRTDSELDDDDVDVWDRKSSHSGPLEYKHLIAIHAGKPKGGLKEALRVAPGKVRRLSLSEQALERAAASYGADVVRFTQKNILRIYPKGTRFNSSNYKPLVGWTHGAQMVAFNMQGYGKSLWVMHGMFRTNGGCGYVKKPEFLMKNGLYDEVFNPKESLPVKTTLKVKVYMGDGWCLDFSPTHFDTYSPPDFYTKLHLVGVPQDCVKHKTKVIEDNWVPIWDEEFDFPLAVPELALLRIEVREYDRSEKDDFGGQTCFLISELRPGIRAVPLFDKKGGKLKHATLEMLIQNIFLNDVEALDASSTLQNTYYTLGKCVFRFCRYCHEFNSTLNDLAVWTWKLEAVRADAINDDALW